jgi:hypothetical protein
MSLRFQVRMGVAREGAPDLRSTRPPAPWGPSLFRFEQYLRTNERITAPLMNPVRRRLPSARILPSGREDEARLVPRYDLHGERELSHPKNRAVRNLFDGLEASEPSLFPGPREWFAGKI